MTPSRGTFRVSFSGVVIAQLFLLALIASPSIFRGWVNNTVVIFVSLVLALSLVVGVRIRLSFPLVASWGVAFSLMIASAIYSAGLAEESSKLFAGVYILIVLLMVFGKLSDARFSLPLLRWWRWTFWIVAVFSIITWILSYTTPSWFWDIDYGELYSGNVRTYSAFLTGIFINQDYGSFALHRVVGILAEPGMMSMLFAINAGLGLMYKNSYFSSRFGLANLIAGFTTYSVAYYLVLSMIGAYLLLKRGYRFVGILGLLTIVITSIVIKGSPLEMVGYLAERSSFHTREGGVISLVNIMVAYPSGVLFGAVWADISAQFPSTALQLLYQCGIIGVLAYFTFIARFTKGLPEISIIFLMYSLTIQYHTYFIVALTLMVVGAFQKANIAVFPDNIRYRPVLRTDAGQIKPSLKTAAH